MEKKYYMGRWELFCLVFNSLVYKIFTHYPASFMRISGSASWLTCIFVSVIFLILLLAVLHFYSPYASKGLTESMRERFGSFPARLISVLSVIYFLFSAYYSLSSICNALKEVSYAISPKLFTGAFILLAASVIAVCSDTAMRRVHSLSVLGVGTAAIVISVLSLRYADIYNLMPILGNGAENVFGKGLSTLFIYSDILVIFFLPRPEKNLPFKKTVLLASLAAVLVNIFVTSAIALNMPSELAAKMSFPIYPLTKTANFGKFPLRLDTIYHIASISSAILYISLALSILIKNVKAIAIKPKKLVSALLCATLCFTLSGCWDSSEIEENAYIIALGIDKGETAKYKYTFQISNPLESGGSIGAEEKASENSSGDNEGNKTVDNIIVEADDFSLARDKLKSVLSKSDKMSHLKLIVFSIEAAREDALSHSELLLKEREIRPSTSLCLAESASAYLMSVNPTLEESTVRYYELFFRNRDMPSAPSVELRDFVGRSVSSAYDAVAPIVSDKGLSGMGIFSNGVLVSETNGDEAVIYKMLCGDLRGVAFEHEGSGVVLTSQGKPELEVNIDPPVPRVNISLYLKSDKGELNADVIAELEKMAKEFLYKTSIVGGDVLGIGRYVKSKFLTQSKWEAYNWQEKFSLCSYNIQILP